MTGEDSHLVRLERQAEPVAKWHVAAADDVGVTTCGRRYNRGEVLDSSKPGKTPSNLNGKTICYRCASEVER